ncbi:MAG: hypothetical protein KME19_16725 [Microcoleus vaginatus WJT46-NPBG5]|nr:hypothetical protein [Microcoleus vaginatus WJT46-NPBG5]
MIVPSVVRDRQMVAWLWFRGSVLCWVTRFLSRYHYWVQAATGLRVDGAGLVTR